MCSVCSVEGYLREFLLSVYRGHPVSLPTFCVFCVIFCILLDLMAVLCTRPTRSCSCCSCLYCFVRIPVSSCRFASSTKPVFPAVPPSENAFHLNTMGGNYALSSWGKRLHYVKLLAPGDGLFKGQDILIC